MLPPKSNLCSLQPRRFSAYQGSKVPQLTTLLYVHDVFSICFIVPVIQLYLFVFLCLLLFIPLGSHVFFPNDFFSHLNHRISSGIFSFVVSCEFSSINTSHSAVAQGSKKSTGLLEVTCENQKKKDVSTNRLSIYQNRLYT